MGDYLVVGNPAMARKRDNIGPMEFSGRPSLLAIS